mmetsp:Transcript_13136/g.30610  ORF Transcript_13136/g.30610 Transcript_13136/m.30610 type:complete len:83 (-) Transcript_13136:898-1146(-)
MSEQWKGFLRAIGLRASFRRTGASSLGNIAVAAFVGAVSGHYIFAEPLRQYWAEQAALEVQQKGDAQPQQQGSKSKNPPRQG